MCGIVGVVGGGDALPVLLDGLRRLEYRGYDSAGAAVLDDAGRLQRARSVGRIAALEAALQGCELRGGTGIAHTRWATHGAPSEANAHPHVAGDGDDAVALVCNGIIENYEELRAGQAADGVQFQSQTDTEVVVNAVHRRLRAGADLAAAVRATAAELEGAFAIAVVRAGEAGRLVGARRGSPLVVGLGEGAAYMASDMAALRTVTREFLVLEDGDVADIAVDLPAAGGAPRIAITDAAGATVTREKYTAAALPDAMDLRGHRHFMHKEIHEQPAAIGNTLEGRVAGDGDAARVLEACFGPDAAAVFDRVREVRIIACGTSYHAGMVAAYWFERHGIPCRAEIASEFRSRRHAAPADCLLVALSQSGETSDTLAAMAVAKESGFGPCLVICNSAESSMVRAADLVLMTHAGAEIGVASTKAFTTQLVALRLLGIALGRRFAMPAEREAKLVAELRALPRQVAAALAQEPVIAAIAEQFADKQHALFLGRGAHYPIALEGALKLKEISYIHAEAYPAGELKHGPLALVDAEMPVISVAPNDRLLDKLKSNIEEVRARGGRLLVFADAAAKIRAQEAMQVVDIAAADDSIAPVIYTIPLQLLAYHVALIKGTDVDKPRNLAKSVTVE